MLSLSVSVSVQTQPKFRYFGFGSNYGFGRSLITMEVLISLEVRTYSKIRFSIETSKCDQFGTN
jgi:hypothetical protein